MNIIPHNPSFAERLGAGLGAGIGAGAGSASEFKKKMQLEELKRKKELKIEKQGQFQNALGTIQQMKALIEKGNLGRGSQFMGLFGGEAARDRATYEQLGRSLIPLVASGVPIRNKQEFEEYKRGLTDPSESDQALLGHLNALEGIFESQISGDSEMPSQKTKTKKIKFNIKNPEHKAKRDQVLKMAKGDREKAEEILMREFDL